MSERPPILYNPAAPALERAIEDRPAELRRYGDHGRYLVHRIAVKQWTGDVDRDGYARLSTAILRHYLCRSEAPWTRYLRAAGIIETAGHSAGNKPRGYRLLAGQGAPARAWPVTNRILARKLAAYTASRRQSPADPPELRAVVRYRQPILAHFDATLARVALDRPAAELAAELARQGLEPGRASFHVATVARGIEPCHVDGFGYRVHHALTWTSKATRPHLRIDGRPLVETDVANCQPLLLAALLTAAAAQPQRMGVAGYDPAAGGSGIGDGDGDGDGDRDREVADMLDVLSPAPSMLDVSSPAPAVAAGTPPSRTPAPSMLDVSSPAPSMLDVSPAEAADFTALAESGKLYGHVGALAKCRTRDAAKKALLRVVFARPEHAGKMAHAFRAAWPTAYAWIQDHKRQAMARDPGKGHGILAGRLQRWEARLVIDAAAAEFIRHRPDAPLYPIHDALVTTAEDAPLAAQVLEDAFSRDGLRAKARTAAYTEQTT